MFGSAERFMQRAVIINNKKKSIKGEIEGIKSMIGELDFVREDCFFVRKWDVKWEP